MTETAYNGFSGKQRDRAQTWLRKEWNAGRLPKPRGCAACGQTQGRIDAHAEDYSEPFRAGVTDQFHLCMACHRQVHDRTKNPAAWREYRAKIEAGGRKKICAAKMGLKGDDQFDWGDPPTRPVLLEIERSQDAVAERLARMEVRSS